MKKVTILYHISFFSHFQTLTELCIPSREEQWGSSYSQDNSPVLLIELVVRQKFSALRRPCVLHVPDSWPSWVFGFSGHRGLQPVWNNEMLPEKSAVPEPTVSPPPACCCMEQGGDEWLCSQPGSHTPDLQLNVNNRIYLLIYIYKYIHILTLRASRDN